MFPIVVPAAVVLVAVVAGRKVIARKLKALRDRPTRVVTREVDRADSDKVTATLDQDTGEWILVGGHGRSTSFDAHEGNSNQNRGPHD